MQVELNDDEVRELVEVLKERLGELRQEVVHADVSTYHDMLKAREHRLSSLLEKLNG